MKRRAKRRSTYPDAADREWIEPVQRGFRLQCCDCGLVHKVNLRVRDGKADMQLIRDNRATAQVRRHRKRRVS